MHHLMMEINSEKGITSHRVNLYRTRSPGHIVWPLGAIKKPIEQWMHKVVLSWHTVPQQTCFISQKTDL